MKMEALKFVNEESRKSYGTIYKELLEIQGKPDSRSNLDKMLKDTRAQLSELVPSLTEEQVAKIMTFIEHASTGMLRVIALQLYLELQIYKVFPALDPQYPYLVVNEVLADRAKVSNDELKSLIDKMRADKHTASVPEAERN